MAQTIKELEKERVELLKAIENQAQTFSARDGSEHTLKDWLNAAEDVMPANEFSKNTQRATPAIKKRAKAMSKSNNQSVKVSRSPFFLTVILLSLSLILIGVIYIGYMSLKNELKIIKQDQDKTNTEISLLKDFVVTLEPKLEDFEKNAQKMNDNSKTAGNNQIVTKSALEARFKKFETKMDSIDEKLADILGKLKERNLNSRKLKSNVKSKDTPDLTINEPVITEPSTPTVKPLRQPVVRLVQKVNTPKTTEIPKAPLADYTLDVKWLMDQPAFNYTLQLASFTDKYAAEKMIKDKSLQGSHIIGQHYKTSKKYVVLSGSYLNKKQAHQAARQYKTNFNLSPWVRKMKDISAKAK